MEKEQLIAYVFQSKIFSEWHYFKFHFNFYKLGLEHPFAKSIIEALINVEKVIPGFAYNIIDRLASLSGRERHLPHYEQLLQVLAEIYVFNQAANYFSSNDNVKFIYEPTSGDSRKNPEFVIETNNYSVGIEVKQPSLINHINKRGEKPYQVSIRIPHFVDSLSEMLGRENITLPRDNPVKDFLISANGKFESFKESSNFYSVLFIVWDDFVYEPISALIGNPSGLFTEGSFAQHADGRPYDFPNVDAVFIDRHLRQFINASCDTELLYQKKHAMEYGNKTEFPFKVIIPNPIGQRIPDEITDCFQVWSCNPKLGAEYVPSDFITWFKF